MLNETLMRYRAEWGRALANFRFERTDDGRIFMPQAKIFIGGVFTTTVNGRDARTDANLVVNEGLDDVLRCYLPVSGRTSVPTKFYFAPYINDVTPAATLTAATYNSVMDEFINYTQANRQEWIGAAVAGQTSSNNASPATITMGVGGGTIRGMALLSAAGKESGSGKLFCCSAFQHARENLQQGDDLGSKYELTAADA